MQADKNPNDWSMSPYWMTIAVEPTARLDLWTHDGIDGAEIVGGTFRQGSGTLTMGTWHIPLNEVSFWSTDGRAALERWLGRTAEEDTSD